MSTWHEPNAKERLEILNKAKTIAIVGASDNPARASYFVSTYLQSASDYKIFFVNPNLETILGQQVYKSLSDIPEKIDIVDVFRKPADIPTVMDEAIKIGAKVFWMQLGIKNQEEAERGDADWRMFAIASGSLIAHMALIAGIGFILAATLLYGCTARGFGSRRVARDDGDGSDLFFILSDVTAVREAEARREAAVQASERLYRGLIEGQQAVFHERSTAEDGSVVDPGELPQEPDGGTGI